jgi:sulfonate transport system permease protein
MPTAWRITSSILVPSLVIAIWEWAKHSGYLPASQSAAPSEILTALATLLWAPSFYAHVAYSLFRLIFGVLIGSILGVSGALLITFYTWPRLLISPSIHLLAGIPVVIWMPFWVMLFGADEAFKISMAAISTFFIVYSNSLDSFRTVGRQFLEVAEMYEKSTHEKISAVLIPASLSAVIGSLRVAASLGWVVIFFVEYAAARVGAEGLGWFIADARQVGRVEQEFAGLLFLGVVAYIADLGLRRLQFRMSAWTDPWRGETN